MTKSRDYNFWVLTHRAEDLPGQWVAHVLELDAVTQGTSLEHALNMAAEAASMIIVDDVNAGRDPIERRAPESEWAPLWALLHEPSAEPTTPNEAGAKGFNVFAAQLCLRVWVADHKASASPGWTVPAMWAARESTVAAG